ncbi:MAG: hypothetical protein AVDCRST_MAG19-2114, partial [uncultured Thermomicrobiales bacterium]
WRVSKTRGISSPSPRVANAVTRSSPLPSDPPAGRSSGRSPAAPRISSSAGAIASCSPGRPFPEPPVYRPASADRPPTVVNRMPPRRNRMG